MASDLCPGCVVFNPNAGSAERVEVLRELVEKNGRIELCRTEARGDAADLAAKAVKDGRQFVLAAGGDGTVSEVVAGLMDAREQDKTRPMPVLLVIPMGTGNDLRRTFDLPEEPAEALALLDAGETRPLDVIRWTLDPHDGGETKRGWCVNVAAGGFAAKLKQVLTPEVKKAWGPLAYGRAALGSAGELVPHEMTFTVDGGPPQTASIMNVVAANARFAGGGIEVAPHADPSDGLIELVAASPGKWTEMVSVTARLLAGELDESKHVFRVPAKTLVLEGNPPLPFNIDGDFAGEGRLSLEIVPGPLQILVPKPKPKGWFGT